jgi:hypothetical protein
MSKEFKIGIVVVILIIMFTVVYQKEGTTSLSVSPEESELPTELKGLKIYDVSTGKTITVSQILFENDSIVVAKK